MVNIQFNKEWYYYKVNDESNKTSVTIPHDAMLSEKRTDVSAGGTNTGWFEGHDYVYEKQFELSPNYRNEVALLEFEGVYHNAEVYLNQQKLIFRPNGYTNFYADITKYLNEDGHNTVKVIAKNSDQPNSRWYSGAGIYRPVSLWLAEKEHIAMNGLKIRTLSYDPAEIEIRVKTEGKGEVSVIVFDGKEAVYESSCESKGEAIFTTHIKNAKLWSSENPYLYTCRVQFKEDSYEENFGIRVVECDSKNGLRINGNRVILRGCCIHHDNGILGASAYSFAEYRKIKILKENGFNAIRSAHNPCSKALLDACDRLGVFVMDEYVDMWYIHKQKNDYASYFEEWWKRDLEDLIDKNYNHPSVIMLSVGNEVSETAQERGIKLAEEMQAFCHEKNPDLLVTCGINIFFNFLSSIGFGIYSDKKAESESTKLDKIEKRSDKKKHKAVGSEFFNNLAGLLGADFMKFGATLHGSDMKTKEVFSKFDIAGYNYGINRYKKDVKKYPERIIVGSETFSSDAYKFTEFVKGHPAVIGDFVWTGFDYLGEVGLGAWEYKNYAPDFSHGVGWITAGSGRIDINGSPQCEMAYMRVAYGLDKIRIGVLPADTATEPHSPAPWRMTNVIESWSWNGCDGNRTKVEVYAKAASVELLINGKSQGIKKFRNDCRFIFKVLYQGGAITAVSYDDAGKELARTSLKTAGDETILNLKPEKQTVNKEELCYVWLKYTDKKGTLKPLARGNIKVSVSGGTLLALGSSCPYNPEGYLNDYTDTYYGMALAIVKPFENGDIVIKAESPYGNSEASIRYEESL